MPQPWYKDAVIYSVDVRRFVDSDGDGVGDFGGLISRLDYLAELGVTCLWLLPCYPSPLRDNGYDVSNYLDVDPRLGGMDGLLELVRAAGERGLRVLLDLVANHTSDEHPWFQAARRNPNSRYRPYYIWAKHPPAQAAGEGPMFPGEQSSVWTYDEAAGAYYFHRFHAFEPELNHGHEPVHDEIERIIDLWMSLGVAGFRLDSAAHLIENGGEREPHPADSQALLRRFYAAARVQDPQAALMAEVDEPPSELARFFEGGDQVSLLLNFYLANYLFLALARGRAAPLVQAMEALPSPPDACSWANFLRNHDELDLEQLSPEDREAVFAAFAPGEEMQVFGRGARRRVAPLLSDPGRLRLAWSLLFALPGAPVIYAGDEIGMGDDLTAQGRNAVRTPMQWNSGPNAGFSSAPAKSLIQPLVTDPAYAPKRVNVEHQRRDENSLFHWLRRLIGLRRSHAELFHGRLTWLDSGSESVLAHHYRTGAATLLLLHNLSNRPVKVSPLKDAAPPERWRDLLTGEVQAPGPEVGMEFAPYGCRWLLGESAG